MANDCVFSGAPLAPLMMPSHRQGQQANVAPGPVSTRW